ncbi:MAG TPA: glycosyltransferase family 4 protein [Kiritimatiellia bacterium]|nr:glycosyltransferase family 4 protein [Kiritimatiellia bacterium]HPS06860.1 glycosyltransferase family 4 protein [Kiritimatiellia bacterium]
MKVLWVDLVSEFGGAQHSLADVCLSLKAAGIDVVAAVPNGPLFDRLTSAGLPVFPVSPVRARKRGWGLFTTAAKLMRAPSSVSQIIRTVKPDIIHANSLPAFLAAHHAFSSIPIIWHVRDLRIPVMLAREASKKAARIIAASEAIDEHLVDILSPRVLGRIRVIRNGVDPTRFAAGDRSDARRRFGLPPDGPVIGMIAHLIPWKRHDAFIQAAGEIRRQRPDAHFVAVGRDLFNEHSRWISQLKERVASNGLAEAFHWVGDCDAAHEILPAFDLLLHPALQEPFGRVICEAMAASVPVIAAASGGPASIIQQGASGILVRDGDPQRMAEEALALLADPARAAKVGAAGRNQILNKFTTRHVCEQLIKEYRGLISSVTSSDDDD